MKNILDTDLADIAEELGAPKPNADEAAVEAFLKANPNYLRDKGHIKEEDNDLVEVEDLQKARDKMYREHESEASSDGVADFIAINGTEVFESLVKASIAQTKNIETLHKDMCEMREFQAKVGKLVAGTYQGINGIARTPQLLKSQRAGIPQNPQGGNPEEPEILKKMREMGPDGIKGILMKASVNRHPDSENLMIAFESNGSTLSGLNKEALIGIANMVSEAGV